MSEQRRGLAAVQTGEPGTYEVREVVSAEVAKARPAPASPGEREPLTWEELLSLPRERWSDWTDPA